MDPMNEEQLDYGEGEYENTNLQHGGNGGDNPAALEKQLIDDDDDFGDLYDDVCINACFMQTLENKHDQSAPSQNSGVSVGNDDRARCIMGQGTPQNSNLIGAKTEQGNLKSSTKASDASTECTGDHHQSNKPSNMNASANLVVDSASRNSGFQTGTLQPSSAPLNNGINPTFSSGSSILPPGPGNVSMGTHHPVPMPTNQTNVAVSYPVMNGVTNPALVAANGNRLTSLVVGELHWWTTDADIENAASQFGGLKEVKFFDERASGKSRGYCQVDFYDPTVAATFKEAMNGYMFHGRACVVKFASAETLREMGANYVRRNQNQTHGHSQDRGNMNDINRRNGSMNYQGGHGGRNNGRGGWNRGTNGGVQSNGGPIRGRGSMGARDMVGNSGGEPALMGPYGQGHGGPAFGGPPGAMLNPQNMMSLGFGPGYLGRGGGGPYASFAAPAFPGMMPQFPAVNPMGPVGVVPHVNPAFFREGMAPGGMGMMGNGGMNINSAERKMGADSGSTGEEQGRRKHSSSRGEDNAPEYGKEEERNEKEGRSHASWEDKGSQFDERDHDFRHTSRDRYREERDGDRYKRQRDNRDYHDDNWDGDKESSRSRSRSRKAHEENHRFHSRDRDYGYRHRE